MKAKKKTTKSMRSHTQNVRVNEKCGNKCFFCDEKSDNKCTCDLDLGSSLPDKW